MLCNGSCIATIEGDALYRKVQFDKIDPKSIN